MALKRLQELEDDMKKCFRCSLCKLVPLPVANNPKYTDCCAPALKYAFHGYSGSGKSIMGMSLLADRIKVDERLSEYTFACMACGYCDVACKFIMDAERHQINMTLREYIVNEGFGPTVHKEVLEKFQNGDGPEPGPSDVTGVKILPRQKAKVLVLGGAMPGLAKSSETTAKLARLLSRAGVDVGVLGEPEPYSGLYAYWTGHMKVFKEMANNAADFLDNLGVKTIVVTSGADFGMFRAKFPEYARAPKAKIIHATEMLDKLIKKKKLLLPKTVSKKVTYHDPCYLGRQSEPPVEWHGELKMSHNCMSYTDPPKPVNRGVGGVYDAPRNILKAINGLEFIEMFRIREYAFCCGGGGGAPDAYPELSSFAAKKRIEEAADFGAEVIITACHQCVKTFNANQDKNNPLPAMDIIDLVYEAAGL